MYLKWYNFVLKVFVQWTNLYLKHCQRVELPLLLSQGLWAFQTSPELMRLAELLLCEIAFYFNLNFFTIFLKHVLIMFWCLLGWQGCCVRLRAWSMTKPHMSPAVMLPWFTKCKVLWCKYIHDIELQILYLYSMMYLITNCSYLSIKNFTCPLQSCFPASQNSEYYGVWLF